MGNYSNLAKWCSREVTPARQSAIVLAQEWMPSITCSNKSRSFYPKMGAKLFSDATDMNIVRNELGQGNALNLLMQC